MMTLSAAPTQHLNKSRCSKSVASSFTKFKYMQMLNGSSLLLPPFSCREDDVFFVCSLSYETLNGRGVKKWKLSSWFGCGREGGRRNIAEAMKPINLAERFGLWQLRDDFLVGVECKALLLSWLRLLNVELSALQKAYVPCRSPCATRGLLADLIKFLFAAKSHHRDSRLSAVW